MRCTLSAVALLAAALPALAQGRLVPHYVTPIPTPPPAPYLVAHKVVADITDQVAVTTVEQTFRNPADRPQEATYFFPVPAGASVNKFAMWIDGKETNGELLDANKAASVYADIVRRTLDPGLLEYMGQGMIRIKVFPVPARSDQKIKLSYTAVLPQDAGVVEYTHPLRTDGKGNRYLEDLQFHVRISCQQPIQTVYSPTHAVTVNRKNDREVGVDFDKNQAVLDKDFQLFFGVSRDAIGLTPLAYKPVTGDDGYFMLLLSPQIEAAKAARVPRDVIMVLDTSGSMTDQKLTQAKKALRFVLDRLNPDDRFGLIRFATVVESYKPELLLGTGDNRERAAKWVDDLRTSGGTAILPALTAAKQMRANDPGRQTMILFFTDGLPTVDETNPDRIVQKVSEDSSSNTRIFTFGVGDDVNAAMLDRLAEKTRAASTYVRPAEDIESKVSGLYNKISHPVLSNVKLSCDGVRLYEIYPPVLPDLFYGSQLVVIGKYSGHGNATIRLSGQVGMETKELTYSLAMPQRTADGKQFVEDLWARRKVGYLMDQIRVNGEQKELVDEVTKLAKRFGIATPYTSYLVLPDAPMPVAAPGRGNHFGMVPAGGPMPTLVGGGAGGGPGGAPRKFEDAAKSVASEPRKPGEGLGGARGGQQAKDIKEQLDKLSEAEKKGDLGRTLQAADEKNKSLEYARRNYEGRNHAGNQSGKLGVDLALDGRGLKEQEKLTQTASRAANGRQCVEVGGAWIDDRFDPKMVTVVVKAQGEAYFRILEKHAEMKDVFKLGNHLVWVSPSGKALVVDANDGVDKLADADIDALFVVAKK